MTATVRVAATQPYEVVIGQDLAAATGELVAGVPGVEQALVLTAAAVAGRAGNVAAALRAAGVDATTLTLPDGEDAKTAAVLQQVWDVLGARGFTRSDLVVGHGGGAVTDLAGFVAATWLRGIRFVTLPTTLLGMVDAAIGGKTGINTDRGKNLVGAFHEPVGVVCDLDLLAGLPVAEYRSGMAEVVKCGFIADPEILDLVEADLDRAAAYDAALTAELVRRSIAVKAAVVSADLREESGAAGGPIGREMLNYGHTLGHAVEAREHYRWRHGDAVAVGLVYAAALAEAAGMIDAGLLTRHRDVLAGLGLPVRYAADAFEQLRATMALDKKARGSTVRFVVLRGLADPVILSGPEEGLLRRAWAAVASGSVPPSPRGRGA